MKLPSTSTLTKLIAIWAVLLATIVGGVVIYTVLKNEGASVHKIQLSVPPAAKKK